MVSALEGEEGTPGSRTEWLWPVESEKSEEYGILDATKARDDQ
jgi:hypothetical protein